MEAAAAAAAEEAKYTANFEYMIQQLGRSSGSADTAAGGGGGGEGATRELPQAHVEYRQWTRAVSESKVDLPAESPCVGIWL